jgi:hypothetical protein
VPSICRFFQSIAAHAVQGLVDRSDGDWSLVEKLVSDGLLIPSEFAGRRFYVHHLRVEAKPGDNSEGGWGSEPMHGSR